MVTGLPIDASEEGIRKHFSDLYQLAEPDWEFKGYLCGLWGRKKPRSPEDILAFDLSVLATEPVRSVALHGKQNYMNSWVADVNIAHPNGSLIRRCQSMKKNTAKLLEARAIVKKFSPGTPLKGGANESKLKKAEEVLTAVTTKIQKINKSLSSSASTFERIDNACMAAFVTFENEDSVVRCLEDYGRYGQCTMNPFTWLSPPMAPNLKYEGASLTISTSPEPSNILWENLETSKFSAFVRKSITTMVTFVMLLVSLAIVLVVQSNKQALAATVPDLAKCGGVGLPAVYDMVGEPISYVHYDAFDEYCEDGAKFIVVENFFDEIVLEEVEDEEGAVTLVLAEDQEEAAQQVIATYKDTCTDPCVSGTSDKITCVGYTDHSEYNNTQYGRLMGVYVEDTIERRVALLADESDAEAYFMLEECPGLVEDPVDFTCAPIKRIADEFKSQIGPGHRYVLSLMDVTDLGCDEGMSPDFNPATMNITDNLNCVQFQKQTVKVSLSRAYVMFTRHTYRQCRTPNQLSVLR